MTTKITCKDIQSAIIHKDSESFAISILENIGYSKEERDNFRKTHKKIKNFSKLTEEEKEKILLILNDPKFEEVYNSNFEDTFQIKAQLKDSYTFANLKTEITSMIYRAEVIKKLELEGDMTTYKKLEDKKNLFVRLVGRYGFLECGINQKTKAKILFCPETKKVLYNGKEDNQLKLVGNYGEILEFENSKQNFIVLRNGETFYLSEKNDIYEDDNHIVFMNIKRGKTLIYDKKYQTYKIDMLEGDGILEVYKGYGLVYENPRSDFDKKENMIYYKRGELFLYDFIEGEKKVINVNSMLHYLDDEKSLLFLANDSADIIYVFDLKSKTIIDTVQKKKVDYKIFQDFIDNYLTS